MKQFSDIVLFVKTAMERELDIYTAYHIIQINMPDHKNMHINLKGNDIYFCVLNISGEPIKCETLTDREVLAFEALILDVEEYNRNRTLKIFDDFLLVKNDCVKSTDDFEDD